MKNYVSDVNYTVSEKIYREIKVREYKPDKSQQEKQAFSDMLENELLNSNFFKTE